MLMFMSPASGEHWATMRCTAELQEEATVLQKVCLRTKSQENVGHAARQQLQAQKSFYQRMVKEEQS